ncbi:phospholipid-binding lipoprotein MlaA [Nitrosomonas sp. Nm51]|uniref:MlaA family lipoprotein n=1 Tax=Nitrosomonas sp. Nm51 TaxID=133720 RepID=UPI0008B5012F|nr:VacJ family lipoprotein [Nitrosomonas sp. Nm51]SER04426.1 phospholipid-binding lipoprotein MlaA [Nitrosomonas sp. Nm51]
MNEKKANKLQKVLVWVFLIVILQGCASLSKKDDAEIDPVDPHEDINRVSYDFTDKVDRVLFEPVVDAYVGYVPNAAQRSIGNFYDNVSYPNVVLNAFLQGKIKQGLADGLRFAINSTVGLFGLFDMATHMGLEKHNEDFGQTLGVWGFEPGSYLFIPILGPSSERDVASVPVSMFTNVLFYVGAVAGAGVFAPLTVLGAIDKRARLAGPMRIRDQAALDPYLFVREASLQQREFLVYDGNPPLNLYDDEPFQDNPFHIKPEKQIIDNDSSKTNHLQDAVQQKADGNGLSE